MAAPKFINELSAGSLSAGGAVAVVLRAGDTVQVPASSFITDAASFTQSGTGAVARTAQGKLRDFVSVVDFMSAADRVSLAAGSTVDVTTALTNSLASLPADGGIVHMPAGNYKITSGISLSRHQGIVGDGLSAATGTDGATTIVKTGSFDGITLSSFECILRDFTIRGDTGNGGDGIYVQYGHANIHNVASNDHGGVGFRFGDKTASGANTNHCDVGHIKAIANTSHGVYLHDANAAANVNSCAFINIDARGNGGDGIKIENSYDNAFFMPSAQLNSGYGVHFASGGKGNFLFFPYTESNTTGQLILDAGSIENVVFGARQGTSDSYTDNGTRNTVVGRDFSKQGDLIWKKLWAVQATISNASFSGNMTLSQSAADTYGFNTTGGGTSDLNFTNTSGSGTIRLKVNGRNAYYKGAYVVGATINHGTVGAASHADATVAVTGARDGMSVIATPRQAAGLPAGLGLGGAWVSANDTVTIRLINPTASGIASNVAWRVVVPDLQDT